MKQGKKILAVTFLLAAFMAVPVYAGEWKQDTVGWWYQQDDGNYLKDGWYWIDGNHDGVSECYLFGSDGYLITDSAKTGGYEVSADGEWMENSVVQIKTETIDENDPVSVYKRAAALARNLDNVDVYLTMNDDVEMLGISATIKSTEHLRMQGAGRSDLRMLLESTKTGAGSEEKVKIFYVDGRCYYDNAVSRIAVAADPRELTEVTGNSAHYLSTDSVEKMNNLSMSWEGENRVITYSLDLSAIGLENTEDTTYEVREFNEVLVIDRNGYCVYQKQTIDISQIIDYGEGFRMTSKIKEVAEMRLENPGQKVDVPIPSTEGYDEIYDLQ